MITILKHPEIAKQMGMKAKERMKNNFTMPIYIDKLTQVLAYSIDLKKSHT